MKKFQPRINITTRPLKRAVGDGCRHLPVLFLLLAMLAVLLSCRCTARAKQHVAQGNRYLEQKQFPEAGNEYQQAIQIDPDFPEAHYRLGLVQIEQQHPSAAIKSLARAVDLDRRNISARLQLGSLL